MSRKSCRLFKCMTAEPTVIAPASDRRYPPRNLPQRIAHRRSHLVQHLDAIANCFRSARSRVICEWRKPPCLDPESRFSYCGRICNHCAEQRDQYLATSGHQVMEVHSQAWTALADRPFWARVECSRIGRRSARWLWRGGGGDSNAMGGNGADGCVIVMKHISCSISGIVMNQYASIDLQRGAINVMFSDGEAASGGPD